MSEPALELPPIGATTGPAAGEEAALRALEENRAPSEEETDRPSDSPGQLDRDPARIPDPAAAAPGEQAVRPAKKAPPKAKEEKPGDRVKEREKRARKLKRDELEVLFLHEAARNDELQERMVALERKAVVAQTVSNELIDESLDDMMGLAIDGTEAAVQLLTPARYVKAIALEEDERDHLVRLSARYAKVKMPAIVEQSPGWALAFGIGAIVAGKLVALKLAQAEERERERLEAGGSA